MNSPGTPKKIASLLAAGTEILYALGLGDRVVAVSHECDYPAEAAGKPRVTRARVDGGAGSRAIDEAVRAIASRHESLYEIDAALLASLGPELIVTQKQCDVCAVSPADVAKAAQACPSLAGAAVVALDPRSIETIYTDVENVARAAGAEAAGARLVAELKGRVEAVRTRAAGATTRPRVLCVEWIEPLMIAANWMPTLVEIAGGRPGLAEAGKSTGAVEMDAVLAFDPEVVVVMPCGFDLRRTLNEAHDLKSYPGWYDMTAFKAKRVYAVDGNAYFNRSGPRIVDSLEILAALIQPGAFKDFGEKYAAAWRRIA